MKRRLAKLVVFLLLGAIVNVAVAWGCALQSIESKLTAIEYRQIQGYGLEWSCTFLHRFGFDRILLESHTSGPPAADPSTLPTYIVLPSISGEASVDKHYVVAGWPRRSFYGEAVVMQMGWENVRTIDDPDYPMITWRAAIAIGDGSSHPSVRPALPVRPLWAGLIANTFFYTVILWLLTLGPFTARRIIRRKRGLCIKCGYDLRGHSGTNSRGGGEVCPECGATTL